MGYNIYTSSKINKDENGVIIGTEEEVKAVHKNARNEEDDFFKIYFNQVSKILELPPTAIAVLLQLCKRMSYANIKNKEDFGGQCVNVGKTVRSAICKELDIKERAYYNNMRILLENEIIRKVENAKIQINPAIVGRGYFHYSPKQKSGGICDIRIAFKKDLILNAVTDEMENEELIAITQDLLDAVIILYNKEKDPMVKQDYAKDIREYQNLITEYKMDIKKTITYTNNVRQLNQKVSYLFSKMEENQTNEDEDKVG